MERAATYNFQGEWPLVAESDLPDVAINSASKSRLKNNRLRIKGAAAEPRVPQVLAPESGRSLHGLTVEEGLGHGSQATAFSHIAIHLRHRAIASRKGMMLPQRRMKSEEWRKKEEGKRKRKKEEEEEIIMGEGGWMRQWHE